MSYRLRVKDRRGEREVLLIDTVSVGRDPSCDISEADPQLSRRHAEFAVSDRGLVARDLNSRNGMLVNGRRVLEAVLHPGDVVQVAGLAVTFVTAVADAEAEPLSLAAGEDERTGLMSPGQVAAAAAASLPSRPRDALRPDPAAVKPLAGPATVVGPIELQLETQEDGVGGAPAGSGEPAAPAPPARVANGMALAAPDRLPDAAGSAASGRPAGPAAIAAPPLSPGPEVPIPRGGKPVSAASPALTGSSWEARVGGQLVMLALVSFACGALAATVSVLSVTTTGKPMAALLSLLAALVALGAALGFGLLVAGRVRRATLGPLAALAARARTAGPGDGERLVDPLHTQATRELADAINELVDRARRAAE